MKIAFRLSALTAGSVLIIVGLYFWSASTPSIDNGFRRKFPLHIVSDLNFLDVKYNSYYFSGFSKKRLFLGNITAPKFLLAVSSDLSDTFQFRLRFLPKDTLYSGVRLIVDDSTVYLTQANPPVLRAGVLNSILLPSMAIRSQRIFDMKPLSVNSILGKKFDFDRMQNVLFKEIMSDSSYDKIEPLLAVDEGIFSSDGLIIHNPAASAWYYVYFYRNRFTRMDTTLNVIYQAKTIDTFDTPQISLGHTNNKTLTTFASAPRLINKSAFCTDSLLFIRSLVMGKGEDGKGFGNRLTIDAYSGVTGNYGFSFYLPKFKGFDCFDLIFHEGTIYALFDRFLVSVKLDTERIRKYY